jgi:hypothetical protein
LKGTERGVRRRERGRGMERGGGRECGREGRGGREMSGVSVREVERGRERGETEREGE